MDGRVRLTPYYFVAGDAVTLGGILATVAPADKRLIHGMSDAIMAPCAIAEDRRLTAAPAGGFMVHAALDRHRRGDASPPFS